MSSEHSTHSETLLVKLVSSNILYMTPYFLAKGELKTNRQKKKKMANVFLMNSGVILLSEVQRGQETSKQNKTESSWELKSSLSSQKSKKCASGTWTPWVWISRLSGVCLGPGEFGTFAWSYYSGSRFMLLTYKALELTHYDALCKVMEHLRGWTLPS